MELLSVYPVGHHAAPNEEFQVENTSLSVLSMYF